ncbi:HAD-like protein [Aureobasidium pullulans]|nr:HAD-like protein [Aureobasidium pullulans]
MSIMRSSIMRSSRTAVSQPLRSTTCIRSYANKQNMDANQGQSSPGTASNVGNPVSSSPEANKINQSRATDARTGSPDTASVQTPVSNPKGAATGQQGEDSSTQQAFKQDPNAPASEKRMNVEEKGQRPLDPADK